MRTARPGVFLCAWAVLFVALGPLASQDRAASPAETAESVPTMRVEILGASVSAGFVDSPLTGGSKDNASAPLVLPLRRWLDGEGQKVQSRADAMMFLEPEKRGRTQVDRALRSEPSVVVAVDFLFWYGYGAVDGKSDAEGEERMRRLRVGLETLDLLPCGIVVGDLPDMRGADRRMLKPHQVPNEADLAAMNGAIATWATGRPRVRVFPLAQLVASMKQEGVTLSVEDRQFATAPGYLLQGDRLHATRLGVAYLAHALHEPIRAALSEDLRERAMARTFVEFCAFTSAEAELADAEALSKKAESSSSGSPEKAQSGGR